MLGFHVAGLANSKTIGVAAGEEGGVAVTVTHAKNAGKPAKRAHTHASKKSFRRNAASLTKIAAGLRPDLQVRAVDLATQSLRTIRWLDQGICHKELGGCRGCAQS